MDTQKFYFKIMFCHVLLFRFSNSHAIQKYLKTRSLDSKQTAIINTTNNTETPAASNQQHRTVIAKLLSITMPLSDYPVLEENYGVYVLVEIVRIA